MNILQAVATGTSTDTMVLMTTSSILIINAVNQLQLKFGYTFLLLFVPIYCMKILRTGRCVFPFFHWGKYHCYYLVSVKIIWLKILVNFNYLQCLSPLILSNEGKHQVTIYSHNPLHLDHRFCRERNRT